MREASAREFAASPLGAYVAGQTWICFCADSEVAGCALWGRLQADPIRTLLEVAPATHAPAIPPHGALIDAHRVREIDASLFPLVESYVDVNRQSLQRVVTRLAIVRPEGLLAAVAEGFFRVVSPPYEVRIFTETRAALRWLGAAPSFGRVLEGAIARSEGTSSLSVQLRELLMRDFGAAASIGEAARRLSLSARTLQRRLQAEGTSFRAEVNAARVNAAQRLLVERDASVAEIAFEVGYASPAHLSAQFRRLVGESPSEWRQRRQKA